MNTIHDLLISFAEVFAAMSPWLVVNFFIDASSAAEAACCASHGLTMIHWICALFLAVMMAYNLIRPLDGTNVEKKQ